MTHHNGAMQATSLSPEVTTLIEQAVIASVQRGRDPMQQGKAGRGRPPRLSHLHLGWAILWCLLQGWPVQLEVWRTLVLGFQGFAPLSISNQAVYKQLSRHGWQAMQDLLREVSGWLGERMCLPGEQRLAPFAREVFALDESKLDQVGRWLACLRDVPAGDARLLAGRLSCVLDVRRQQWRRVEVFSEAIADCKEWVSQLLLGLPTGSLLLMDLGYFSFEWFDTLTQQGYYWISRMRRKTSYQIIHLLVQRDGYLEALVWLGTYRADQARYAVRLIEVRHRGQRYRYLSNVLDPTQLSGAEVVRLYARRWDIELAFRTLKDHLHLRWLWSAKWEVISVQILASVLLANVFQAAQHEIAAQAGVEVFEVSMDLLVRYLPRLHGRGLNPMQTVVRAGRHLGIIRPSTRLCLDLPELLWHEVLRPPDDLLLQREPRYAHNPGGHARRKQNTTS